MIRDPSDGTVREKAVDRKSRTTDPTPALKPGMTSGLPITSDPKEIERLNRSRAWLQNYKRKAGE